MASELKPEAIAELRRLHAEAVSNAGGDFEVDCDEAFRIFCMKNVPALLDAAERCAAAEAQAKAAGELLMGAVHCDTTYVSGHDAIEVNLDHFHRLCEARNAAIRMLLPAERAGVKP